MTSPNPANIVEMPTVSNVFILLQPVLPFCQTAESAVKKAVDIYICAIAIGNNRRALKRGITVTTTGESFPQRRGYIYSRDIQ